MNRFLSVFICATLFLCDIATGSQRIALVIGNGDYREAPLGNPVKDATDVSNRLADLGFEVISITNADLRTMQDRFLSFIERIEPGATAMVYYAGHGIQANGANYLLPIDATIQSEKMLRFEALEVSDILDELERSGSSINLVVLDACRNNPFEARYRGGTRGLAVMDAAAGTLIAYATAPGSVASDGSGDNGLYTQAFLNALDTPGLKVEEVFKTVRIEVSNESRGQQIPWESSSLTGDFVFNATESEVAANDVVAILESPPATRPATSAPATEESICDDLSGRWMSHSEATGCGSEYWLTRTAENTYRMTLTLCNVPMLKTVTGETVVDGQLITTHWKAATCSGITTGRLASNCRTVKAEARVTSGLKIVCGSGASEASTYVGVP